MADLSRFPLEFKSTINYWVTQFANASGVAFYEGDAVGSWATVQESQGPAISTRFIHWAEDPVDPLYEAIVEIGAQTSLDPAQYQSVGLIGVIGRAFSIGSRFRIGDYTGANIPTAFTGVASVAQNLTEESAPGPTSSLRVWRFKLKINRVP